MIVRKRDTLTNVQTGQAFPVTVRWTAEPGVCCICGRPMAIYDNGSTNHLLAQREAVDDIDYDQDRSHVARLGQRS